MGPANMTANMTAGPQGPMGPANMTANMTAGPQGPPGPGGVFLYSLYAQGLSYGVPDAGTFYFGSRPATPVTNAGRNKIFIPKDGYITGVLVYSYAGTAGSAESWGMYLALNGSTANTYWIQNLTLNTAERIWVNSSMNMPVQKGNYIEVMSKTQTMATNPATWVPGAYIYLNATDAT
jgi:hypothetical protein